MPKLLMLLSLERHRTSLGILIPPTTARMNSPTSLKCIDESEPKMPSARSRKSESIKNKKKKCDRQERRKGQLDSRHRLMPRKTRRPSRSLMRLSASPSFPLSSTAFRWISNISISDMRMTISASASPNLGASASRCSCRRARTNFWCFRLLWPEEPKG